MSIWIWIVVFVVLAVGLYLWKSVREANDEVERIVSGGSMLEGASADVSYQLGMGALTQGNISEAMTAFRRAELLGHEESAQQLGGLLEKQNKLEEAKAIYKRNLERGYAPAALNIATILKAQGDYLGAIAMIHRARNGGVEDTTGYLDGLISEMETAISQRDATAATAPE